MQVFDGRTQHRPLLGRTIMETPQSVMISVATLSWVNEQLRATAASRLAAEQEFHPRRPRWWTIVLVSALLYVSEAWCTLP